MGTTIREDDWKEVGGVLVRRSEIVAIEKGDWNNDGQDWSAVLVHKSGTRIKAGCSRQQAMVLLDRRDEGCASSI